MSLLDEYMEECTFVEKTRVSDGEGGFTTAWTDGASFEAAITIDNSMTARIAEKEGVKNVYTVTVSRSVPLAFHDVFRRKRDRQIFRVTSNSDDKMTPERATIDMAQVSAEEWVLP